LDVEYTYNRKEIVNCPPVSLQLHGGTLEAFSAPGSLATFNISYQRAGSILKSSRAALAKAQASNRQGSEQKRRSDLDPSGKNLVQIGFAHLSDMSS
jgi:hypothetical protein